MTNRRVSLLRDSSEFAQAPGYRGKAQRISTTRTPFSRHYTGRSEAITRIKLGDGPRARRPREKSDSRDKS